MTNRFKYPYHWGFYNPMRFTGKNFILHMIYSNKLYVRIMKWYYKRQDLNIHYTGNNTIRDFYLDK